RSTSAMVVGKPATWTRTCPRRSPKRQRRRPSAPSRPPSLSALAKADFGSNMETLVFRVDELGRHDAGAHLLVLQRKGADDLLAGVRQSALIKTEGDVFLNLGRPGDRGDIAAAVAFDFVVGGEQDGAAAQPLVRLQAFDADQAPALRRLHV